jgi:hypothetical protein
LLLSPRELRKAGQNAEIAWVEGKKGVVLYHPDDLATYLSSKSREVVKKCQQGYGSTAAIELAPPTAQKVSTPTPQTRSPRTCRWFRPRSGSASAPSSSRMAWATIMRSSFSTWRQTW